MIRFTFEGRNGEMYLGLGLTRENVNRLTEGRALRVDLSEMQVAIDGKIMIYFAETEQQLMNAVSEFIGPQTKVTIDPRMKAKLT